jgi:DNA-binding CsgD family transcriptional regulator
MKTLEIGELFEEIERTEGLKELWALMVHYFHEQGFDAVGYVMLDRARTGETVAILEDGFPPEIVHAYAEMGYGVHDATLRVVMSTGRPEAPSRVAERFKLSREESQHRNIIQGLGMGDALCLPLFGPLGRDAYGVLSRPRDPDFLNKVKRTELHMAAQAGHLKALSMQPRQPIAQHSLSHREVEILRWVAQGKSNSVIAEILSLSAGTVDTYLRRIFEKLDVADRTSAAVKGVSLGLIRA